MTQERKCYLSPEDILAVRFRCAKCQAASIVPVNKLIGDGNVNIEITRTCGYCRTVSGFSAGTQAFEDFANFNVLLGKLASILKGTNIEFSLQVDCAE